MVFMSNDECRVLFVQSPQGGIYIVVEIPATYANFHLKSSRFWNMARLTGKNPIFVM